DEIRDSALERARPGIHRGLRISLDGYAGTQFGIFRGERDLAARVVDLPGRAAPRERTARAVTLSAPAPTFGKFYLRRHKVTNNAAAARARAKGEFMSIKNTDGRPMPGRRGGVGCSSFFLPACAGGRPVLQGCQGAPITEGTRVASTTEELQSSAQGLREYIAEQLGGLDKLTVPPNDEAIPLPPEDPARPGRYKTTEAKRYLGKLLFHDP